MRSETISASDKRLAVWLVRFIKIAFQLVGGYLIAANGGLWLLAGIVCLSIGYDMVVPEKYR